MNEEWLKGSTVYVEIYSEFHRKLYKIGKN